MSNAILATLLTVNLAAGAAILLVLIARKPVRQMLGARAAYGLWIAPLLAGLAGIVPARTITLTIPAAPAPTPMQLDAPIDFSAPPPALPAVAASHAPALPQIDIAQLLVIAWAVVAAAMLVVILLRQQRIVRRLGRDSAVGPAVVGVLRPRLIMPVDFETRFSARERDLVLAHERAHIAAGDTRINAGLALLTCLNWFNPLVHLAARLARADQELACDAAVVERFPGERRIYAEALLKTQLSSASLPLGCTWPARSSNLLKERVMMLALKSPGRKRRMIGAAAIATLGLSAGLAAWAARPAETVYVEEPAPPAATTAEEQKIEKLSRDIASEYTAEQQAFEKLEQDTARNRQVLQKVQQPVVQTRSNGGAVSELLPLISDERIDSFIALRNERLKTHPPKAMSPEQLALELSPPTPVAREAMRLPPPEPATGHIIPDGQIIETAVTASLPDGSRIGPYRMYSSRPNGIVGYEWATGDAEQHTDGDVRFVGAMIGGGDADGLITMNFGFVVDGQPMRISRVTAKPGGSAEVNVPGGYSFTMRPILRPMTALEQQRFDMGNLQPIKQVTPPVEASELRIVAVKRGRLTIRSPKGETFVDRVFEPGESYAPKLGAGWRAEVDDGAAFEWRMGDKPLALPYVASGPTQQNVDAIAQQARLKLGLDANKTEIERQVQIEKLIDEKQAKLGDKVKPDDKYEKAIESEKNKTTKLNPDADQQLYYRLRQQLNAQAPINAGSRLPDGQMIEATGSVTVGDKETVSLGTYSVLPGDVSVKSVKLKSGKWFAVASRYDAMNDGTIIVRSAALIDGEVVANPTLTVKSGQEARLKIGGVIDLRIKPTLQEMTAEDRNAAKAIQTVKPPAPPKLDPAKLQAPTFQVIQPPTFVPVPQTPTFVPSTADADTSARPQSAARCTAKLAEPVALRLSGKVTALPPPAAKTTEVVFNAAGIPEVLLRPATGEPLKIESEQAARFADDCKSVSYTGHVTFTQGGTTYTADKVVVDLADR